MNKGQVLGVLSTGLRACTGGGRRSKRGCSPAPTALPSAPPPIPAPLLRRPPAPARAPRPRARRAIVACGRAPPPRTPSDGVWHRAGEALSGGGAADTLARLALRAADALRGGAGVPGGPCRGTTATTATPT